MATSLQFEERKPADLRPDPRNARTHSAKQIAQIAKSIEGSTFANPILLDEHDGVIAGHGRLLAAKSLGLTTVPTIKITGLTPLQVRTLRLADNKIALNAGWDLDLLTSELEQIELEGVDLELIGFSTGEIDGLRLEDDPDDDAIPAAPVTPATRLGDIWRLGPHRVGCGDVKDTVVLDRLMAGAKADAAFLDPPYNVKVDGHAGGKGRIKHREFAEASGEMSCEAFADFLTTTLGACAGVSRDGAVHFVCMDHHHVEELVAAGAKAYAKRLNIATWVKSNAGMGSLYRSGHELVFVYRVGQAQHRNNVELGKHGRNRTNVWEYASVNTFGGSRRHDLALHPTVKPAQLVADAIQDVTARGELVLDAFLGSGTTLIAAERTGRRFVGLDIDPVYVDVAITRWSEMTGGEPVLEATGEALRQVVKRRVNETPEIRSRESAEPVD